MYKKLAIAILLLAPLMAMLAQELGRQVPQALAGADTSVANESGPAPVVQTTTPAAMLAQPVTGAPAVTPAAAAQGFGDPFPSAGQPMMDPTPVSASNAPEAPPAAPPVQILAPGQEPPPPGVLVSTYQADTAPR